MHWRWLLQHRTIVWMLVVLGWLLFGRFSAVAQDEFTPSDSFDVNRLLGILSDASAEGSLTERPFTGLASPIAVDPLFGTATASIPIDLPPGRGLTPDLTIRYSSNAPSGSFGMGWGLPLGSVQRNLAAGVPVDAATGLYVDALGFQLMLGGRSVVLDTCIDVQCSRWGASTEEIWLDAFFNRALNRWEIRSRDGLRYTYGATAAARTGMDVGVSDKTYAWYLTEIRDPNDNTVEVERDGVELLNIHYGGNASAGLPHIFHVEFGYQGGSAVTNFRAGFSQTPPSLVNSLIVRVDGAPLNPLREYLFTYEFEPDTLTAVLSEVRLVVPGDASPPATILSYTLKDHAFALPVNVLFDRLPSAPAVSAIQRTSSTASVTGTQSGFLDVNGDRLPDFLDGFAGGGGAGLDLYLNRGGGRFQWAGAPLWTTQTAFLSADYTSSALGRIDPLPLVKIDPSADLDCGSES